MDCIQFTISSSLLSSFMYHFPSFFSSVSVSFARRLCYFFYRHISMAGKANKNKGKAKPVVNGSQIESKGNHVETKGSHVEDIENHCKTIADENVVIAVGNSDAEIRNDTNEKKVESFGISESEPKEISENGSSVNVKPDIALSSDEAPIEGQPEGKIVYCILFFPSIFC